MASQVPVRLESRSKPSRERDLPLAAAFRGPDDTVLEFLRACFRLNRRALANALHHAARVLKSKVRVPFPFDLAISPTTSHGRTPDCLPALRSSSTPLMKG
jgi:hypothetical protein